MYHLIVIGSIIFSLYANQYFVNAYTSIVSAPVYDHIIATREDIFSNNAGNKKIPVLKSYDLALKENISGKQNTITYLKLVNKQPSLFYTDNGISDDSSIAVLKNFYNVDSVTIEK